MDAGLLAPDRQDTKYIDCKVVSNNRHDVVCVSMISNQSDRALSVSLQRLLLISSLYIFRFFPDQHKTRLSVRLCSRLLLQLSTQEAI